MSKGITLVGGGITLPLKLFSGSTFPREQITPAIGVGFSAYGTPNTDGTSYEPKNIWNFVAIVSPADAELLDVLETIGRTENILIYDYTRRVWDTAARSRALAPGASEVTKGSQTGYYAQFYGRVTQPIKPEEDGAYLLCAVQLTETDRVLPA